MRIVTKVFLARLKLISIAEIFITNSGKINTTCGSRFSNKKVWIKVCNLHFRKPIRLYEQEPGEPFGSARLGLYVQRWVRWTRACLPLDDIKVVLG